MLQIGTSLAAREADVKHHLDILWDAANRTPDEVAFALSIIKANEYDVAIYRQQGTLGAAKKCPGVLFCAPKSEVPERSEAEELVLKLIKRLQYPPMTTVERNRGYYKDDGIYHAQYISVARAILWRIHHRIQQKEGHAR